MRDQGVEHFLDRAGVSWEYRDNVQIAEIDRQASLTNQARIVDRVRQDVVDSYALAMIDGDVFPALVAVQRPDGSYVLLGGNHRLLAAIIAELKLVSLYLVKTSDQAVIHLVTTTLNNLVGWRPEQAETLEQAIQWVQRYGRSVKAAASEYRISQKVLTTELRARDTKNRCRRLGVKPPEFSKSTWDRLGSINNDVALLSVVALAESAKLTSAHLDQLVIDIREQRTEAGQLALVDQWRERDDIKRRTAENRRGIVTARSRPEPKSRLAVYAVGLKRLAERHPTPIELGITSDGDRESARAWIDDAITALERWRNGL